MSVILHGYSEKVSHSTVTVQQKKILHIDLHIKTTTVTVTAEYDIFLSNGVILRRHGNWFGSIRV